MDPISTALTTAWLDAVRRVQSERLQRLEEIMPQASPAHDERSLTDVIERALESGGAAPFIASEEEMEKRKAKGFTTHLVDVLL